MNKTYIAYQNTLLDGVQSKKAVFVTDTIETFQPPMYGLRADYQDVLDYQSTLVDLTAKKKAAEANLDKQAIATAEVAQEEKQNELDALLAELRVAEEAEEKNEAKIAELTAAKDEAEVAVSAFTAELVELRSAVTEIEKQISALVKPDKVLPFVIIDSIEEYEGRAELVGGKVLFDTDIDVAKMQALEEQYTVQVQKMLDDAAKALGYDSCLSVCSYIDTGVEKFDAEGKQFRAWRSAIWARGYELLAEVKAGSRPVPTPEELPELMPKLEEFADAV